jgi:hypothetical protein
MSRTTAPDTQLSPAAQAILDAYHEEAIDYIESWGSFSHKRGMAAALRAAADSLNHATSAHTLHAIADELEGVKYGTYRCNLEGK